MTIILKKTQIFGFLLSLKILVTKFLNDGKGTQEKNFKHFKSYQGCTDL